VSEDARQYSCSTNSLTFYLLKLTALLVIIIVACYQDCVDI